MERKALGKGIGALIPERLEGEEKQEKVFQAPIDRVKPNPLQPREDFDNQGMEDLIQSIREKGVIQPILARRQGDYFEIIAGERRYRAAKSLNLKEIPVIVKDVDDKDSLEIALIENIQRQDLNVIEEARAYKYLIDKFQLTQDRLSEVLGKARTTVTNTLRLLELPQEIQNEVRNGRISFAHGRALLEVQDSNYQRKLAQEVISKGLSVKELETLIRTRRPRIAKQRMRSQQPRDPFVSVLEEELQHALATKVRINKSKKRGTITIEFYSQEDLERVVAIIRGKNNP